MQQLNIVLKHYSKLKPIRCTVISGDINKLFTVKIDGKERKDIDIFKGDPVLIGYSLNSKRIKIWGGSVIAAMPKENSYIICSKEFEEYAREEKRDFERYDTSLLADIKLSNSSKREPACIKDVSFAGMCIFSTGDYNINDRVDINLYYGSNALTFQAEVIRKEKLFNRNEYGVKIIHKNKNDVYTAKNCVDSIKQNDKDLIIRFTTRLALRA